MEMMETIETTRVTSFAAVFRAAHPHPHPNLQAQNGSNATFCLMRGQHRGGTKVCPLLTWLSEPKHKIPGSRARQMFFPSQVVEVVMSYNDWRLWSTYFIVFQNSWRGISTLCFGCGWLTQKQLVGRSAWETHLELHSPALHKRILSGTIQRLQVLHYKPWMLRSETENPNGVLETFLTMLDPHGPGNPSRMVVHVCCQKTRHGWILIWKQTSFGLAVFLEHSLVEKGPKTKCCRFCNLHWGCSHQGPYFDPTVHFILVALCSTHKTKATISWFDVTLKN